MSYDRHVLGIFHDRDKAERALAELTARNFAQSQISLLITDDGRGHHFKINENQTKTAEGVGYGAVLGGLVAGLTALALPGSIFIAGPLAATLASSATGAAAGGLVGGLIGIGVAEDEVKLVEDEIGRGSIVVAVHSIDKEKEDTAQEVLKNAGAVRVH